MGRAVQMPGVSNIWTMPIVNRIDMLTTGVRSEVGVKIFGNDLAVLEDIARRVSDVVRQVPGAGNVYPEQLTNGQYLNIQIDRAAAARYGISVADIQQVIETAIGETELTTTIEGRRRFPGASPIRGGIPRQSGDARSGPGRFGHGNAGAAGASRAYRARTRAGHDFVRERAACRHGAPERAGTRRWRVRRRGEEPASGGRSHCRPATTSVGAAGGRTRSTHANGCRSSCRSCCW